MVRQTTINHICSSNDNYYYCKWWWIPFSSLATTTTPASLSTMYKMRPRIIWRYHYQTQTATKARWLKSLPFPNALLCCEGCKCLDIQQQQQLRRHSMPRDSLPIITQGLPLNGISNDFFLSHQAHTISYYTV